MEGALRTQGTQCGQQGFLEDVVVVGLNRLGSYPEQPYDPQPQCHPLRPLVPQLSR